MEVQGERKSLFILNPYAGIIPVKIIISEELKRRKNELSYFKSLSIDDSGSRIKQSFEKYDIFIAAGGDGTVRSVASELIGTNKILGVLPMGSGNGFAKELGFRTNIRSLLKDIKKAEKLQIDVIKINDMNCLNVAGVGLDSFVAHSFDRLKTRGFWSYAWVTMINFARLKPVNIEIIPEGEEKITEDLFVFTIANTRQFGNNAYIAPDARPDDGIVDLVMIRPFPKFMFPVFIYRLFRGSLKESKYVKYLRTDKPLTIRTSETRFHIDGEAVEIPGDVSVKVISNALSVLKTRNNKL
ncbi:MAG: diacylglycerol kinase [Bacteroidales bacterium]|jgi:YegS/Rv2252/BmrU family lipid kinase|nr:diacylglycerol kinase [Bacteroidales bacterium]